MLFAKALRRTGMALLPLALALSAAPVAAQDDAMTAIAIPDQPAAIPLGTGTLPGAAAAESWHMQYGSRFARNVVQATLTPFLPDPAKATGAAVIVAPGGGFRTLSMDNEGWDVARALADRGVAAFVLKYRLNQTPEALEVFANWRPEPRPAPATPAEALAALQPQLEDSRAAFALVRSRAAEWGVDPDKIGMIGFSAGARLTMATQEGVAEARPAFLGNIYGPMNAQAVAADAPPLFIALAVDDPLFPNTGFGLVESWRDAGRPVEFHYYEQGGHGFGMYPKTTTSTGWFEAFAAWLRMHGFIANAG
ncbi:alpha/beta hydrolase [Alteraurantiacibacter palmitatis]|uniref:Alpha/beta hydrolase n=1 Tax=Alteraurantiacibacter palmitatis TaxID=2054628 RepID=A0ABV7EBA9_9SPHN